MNYRRSYVVEWVRWGVFIACLPVIVPLALVLGVVLGVMDKSDEEVDYDLHA